MENNERIRLLSRMRVMRKKSFNIFQPSSSHSGRWHNSPGQVGGGGAYAGCKCRVCPFTCGFTISKSRQFRQHRKKYTLGPRLGITWRVVWTVRPGFMRRPVRINSAWSCLTYRSLFTLPPLVVFLGNCNEILNFKKKQTKNWEMSASRSSALELFLIKLSGGFIGHYLPNELLRRSCPPPWNITTVFFFFFFFSESQVLQRRQACCALKRCFQL